MSNTKIRQFFRASRNFLRVISFSMIGIVVLFGLLFFLLGVDVEDANAQVATSFPPVADSYVESGNPGTNYGTSTQVRADGSPIVQSYLRFNVQGVTGNVTQAVLRIRANSNHSTGFVISQVTDTAWGEGAINYNNKPDITAGTIGSSGPLTGGNTYDVVLSPVITENGLVSFALTTSSSTAMSLASRESATPPVLIITTDDSTGPTPTTTPTNTPTPTPIEITPTTTPTPTVTPGRIYAVSRTGDTYSAQSSGAPTYTNTKLKIVVESSVDYLHAAGGGTISFTAGTFDLGSDYFRIRDRNNISFVGQGIDVTFLQNNSSAAADTEPFNFGTSNKITIRDLTVSAGGPARSTSDALDFDVGNDTLIERVKVIQSRGRGIVFDGKDQGATALRNIVKNCIVTGVTSDGIELLASSGNRIEGCTITSVGGHGIQLAKSSSSSSQPNKTSNDNIIIGNSVTGSGLDGINLNGGNNNTFQNNTLNNNSRTSSNRDGIRIGTSDNVACNNNLIQGNTATDTNAVKRQAYGLHISSSVCNGTRVGGNNFTGNKTGAIRNQGTGTVFF